MARQRASMERERPSLEPVVHSFVSPQLRSSPTKYEENMSPSLEPHAEGRPA